MNLAAKINLEGRKALVTGAGRGLGKCFALSLAESGAAVAFVDIDGDAAESAAEEAGKRGLETFSFACDLREPGSAGRMVEAVEKRWGGLDIAVNNAGVAIPIKGAEEVSDEDWRYVMELNLHGVFRSATAEAEAMKGRGYGKIVNVASICGRIVWPEYQAVYSVSKAGVIHMTRCLAVEWIRHGIRVNSVSPGVTETPELFPEVIPVFLQKAPAGRIAAVDDIAGAVVFLASPASDFIIGQDIVVDGGYTLA